MIDVQRLYERWGLEKVVLRHERSGPELYACCPFHGENTPSFSTNIETGKWYCFTCHERGTEVESLIQKMEGFHSKSEIDLFMREYGTVTVDERTAKLKEKLASLQMKRLPEPEDLTEDKNWDTFTRYEPRYLYQRGFDSATVGAHYIGYDKGNEEIVIPVLEHGKCRFTYTRTTTKRKRAKYLYPKDIDRARYFWGLDKDKDAYDGATIILNEGALDALWLRQQGHEDTLGILGSHVSQLQIKKLLALNPAEVILFFDNDDAGYEALKDAGKRLQAAGMNNVSYVRYPKGTAGADPQSLTKKQIDRMLERRRHVRHFYLKDKIAHPTQVRRGVGRYTKAHR
jgi:DNA primase